MLPYPDFAKIFSSNQEEGKKKTKVLRCLFIYIYIFILVQLYFIGHFITALLLFSMLENSQEYGDIFSCYTHF